MQEAETAHEDGGEEVLQLNPYVIKERQSTYTSLTDQYGVFVFTNRFRQSKQQIETEAARQNEQLMQDIFNGRYLPEEQVENGLESLLFIKEKEQVIRQENNDTVSVHTLGYGIALMGAGLLFGALLLQYHRKKKKVREEHVADIKLDDPAAESAAGHTGQ